MNILHTIFLGIVEGVTEFLPISSTAHLDIARTLLSIQATDFVKSFEIIIQLGAILAVVVLYWKKIFKSWLYFRNIVIAFIPTGIIGFILYKIIKSFLLGNNKIELLALFLGGIIILYFEYRQKKMMQVSGTQTVEELSVRQLLTLGVVQAIAVIPGVSRSGAVIVGGRIMKISAPVITEFSFVLAVPTMLAATLYDIYKSGFSITGSEWEMIFLGFVVSFVVALIVVKWLINYVKNHSFTIFGWYRIVFSILIFLVLFFR
jgi:undecaprenyl-diphosphatase